MRRVTASAAPVAGSIPRSTAMPTNPASCTPSAPGTRKAADEMAWISASMASASSSETSAPSSHSASQISSAPAVQAASCHRKQTAMARGRRHARRT